MMYHRITHEEAVKATIEGGVIEVRTPVTGVLEAQVYVEPLGFYAVRLTVMDAAGAVQSARTLNEVRAVEFLEALSVVEAAS